MAKRKKRRDLGPRRKRMQRGARLQSANAWRPSLGGKNIVRGYARWYGVDRLCAIIELRLIGVEVPAEYEAALRRSIDATAKARAARRAARARPTEIAWPDDWPDDCYDAPTRAIETGWPDDWPDEWRDAPDDPDLDLRVAGESQVPDLAR